MKLRRTTAIMLLTLMLWSALFASAWADTGDDPHEHMWVERSRVEATCTSKGSVTYYCEVCGQTMTTEIPRKPHDYGMLKITRVSTCTVAGEGQRTCRVCGHVDIQILDLAPHAYGDWTMTREATCAEEGELIRTCAVCDQVEMTAIQKKPHDWSEWEIVTPATDHSSGVRTRVCRACGEEEREAFDPEGTLHPGDRGDAVKALQEGLICYGLLKKGGADGRYGKGTAKAVRQLQEAEGLEPDGVAWPQTRAFAQHRFGAWKTISKLSRTEDGVRERVCERCSHVEREVVEARPYFKRGQKSKAIQFIQGIFEDLGYKPGRHDGVWGPKLEAVIENWGRDHDWWYLPGLLRPIDVDWIVGEWIELLPEEEWIGVSAEDTPVNLVLTLTPEFVPQGVIVGDKLTYGWTVTNQGTEDCTLGPIMYSFGEGNTSTNVKKQYRFVADIDGNLLKAGGANSLSGTLTVAPEDGAVEWSKDADYLNGDLVLNVWALGTSRETGKKWYSNTAVEKVVVWSEEVVTVTDLHLAVQQTSPRKATYSSGDEVTFKWTLINEGDRDMTLKWLDVYALSDEEYNEIICEAPLALPAKGAGSLSDTCTLTLKENWIYSGSSDLRAEGRWNLSFQASAVIDDGDGKTVYSRPVVIYLDSEAAESAIVLEMERTSNWQESYEPGDRITFQWTVTNVGPEDCVLKEIAVSTPEWGSLVSDRVALLPANAQRSPTDTCTVTLDKKWIYDGASPHEGEWWLTFHALADPVSGGESLDSNPVEFRFEPKDFSRRLVLKVVQTSPRKKHYDIGEKVTFKWMLTNMGPEDMTLDGLVMDWGDPETTVLYDQPLALQANGANSVSDTLTLELLKGKSFEDAWHVHLFALAVEDGAASGERRYSNDVYLELQR